MPMMVDVIASGSAARQYLEIGRTKNRFPCGCSLSLSVELHRKLYGIRLLDIACGCNSSSDADSSGSLRLCFVTTHYNSFNGFARRSAATGLRKGSSCVLVLISMRRYANCARWKEFYKNVALSA